MIGILIVTHGDFGKELKKSAELIVGTINYCETISLERDDDIFDLKIKVEDILEDFNKKLDGTIVLVDLKGGSPFNICSLLLKQGKSFSLLSGVNMAMLLECSVQRNSLTVEELASHCRVEAINNITNYSLNE